MPPRIRTERPGRSGALTADEPNTRGVTVTYVSGYVSRRGWIVRDSVESDDRRLCVDFFEDPDGGFGFEQFRFDPEDGGWTPISAYAGVRYATADEAVRRALELIPWLADAAAWRRLAVPPASATDTP
jgi:hypothetical protein